LDLRNYFLKKSVLHKSPFQYGIKQLHIYECSYFSGKLPFHRDVARAQAKNVHAAIADIYFTELVLGSLITLTNNQGHAITDVDSLYEFSQMARVPTNLFFGQHKSESIADLAASSKGSSSIKWLLK